MRLFRTILGMLLLTMGLPAMLVGAGLWTTMQHRDAGGAFSGTLQHIAAPGYAIVVGDLDTLLRADAPFARMDDTRLRLTGTTAAGPAFIGIAPAEDAARYLDDVAHSRVATVDLGTGALPVVTRRITGARTPPGPPARQTFWLTSGNGHLDWNPADLRDRRYSLVVMNAGARPGVRLTGTAELRPGWLNQATWALLVLGSLLIVGGMMTLAWPGRRRDIVYVVEPSQVPELAKRIGAPLPVGRADGGLHAVRPRTLADASMATLTAVPANLELSWPPEIPTATEPPAPTGGAAPPGRHWAPASPTGTPSPPSVPAPSAPLVGSIRTGAPRSDSRAATTGTGSAQPGPPAVLSGPSAARSGPTSSARPGPSVVEVGNPAAETPAPRKAPVARTTLPPVAGTGRVDGTRSSAAPTRPTIVPTRPTVVPDPPAPSAHPSGPARTVTGAARTTIAPLARSQPTDAPQARTQPVDAPPPRRLEALPGRPVTERQNRRRAAEQPTGERQIFEASAVEAWVAETAAARRVRDTQSRAAAAPSAEQAAGRRTAADQTAPDGTPRPGRAASGFRPTLVAGPTSSPAMSSPASSSPASSSPASSSPASSSPASSSPASFSPASFSPASFSPASSSPASAAPISFGSAGPVELAGAVELAGPVEVTGPVEAVDPAVHAGAVASSGPVVGAGATAPAGSADPAMGEGERREDDAPAVGRSGIFASAWAPGSPPASTPPPAVVEGLEVPVRPTPEAHQAPTSAPLADTATGVGAAVGAGNAIGQDQAAVGGDPSTTEPPRPPVPLEAAERAVEGRTTFPSVVADGADAVGHDARTDVAPDPATPAMTPGERRRTRRSSDATGTAPSGTALPGTAPDPASEGGEHRAEDRPGAPAKADRPAAPHRDETETVSDPATKEAVVAPVTRRRRKPAAAAAEPVSEAAASGPQISALQISSVDIPSVEIPSVEVPSVDVPAVRAPGRARPARAPRRAATPKTGDKD